MNNSIPVKNLLANLVQNFKPNLQTNKQDITVSKLHVPMISTKDPITQKITHAPLNLNPNSALSVSALSVSTIPSVPIFTQPKNLPNTISKPVQQLVQIKNFIITPSVLNANVNFPSQTFNGSQLCSLYNISSIAPSLGKRKVKIAVIIAYTYPNLRNDLTQYWTNYTNFGNSVPVPTVNVHTMPGAIFNSGWALEECLDVQMVCTINPNAEIWVIEARSASLVDLSNAINYAVSTVNADVLSMSWGADDSTSVSTVASNNLFTNTSTCFCAASGDSNTVSWPAVSSNCIAVGGSSLIWNPNTLSPLNRTEFTWVRAGAGISKTIINPSYQSNVNTGTYRSIPDVSMIASTNTCVYIYYSYNTNTPWQAIAGTSVSTPIFASVLSLANQARINANKSLLTTVYTSTPLSVMNVRTIPTNNIQNYLYKSILTNPTKYSAIFYDIKIGNDTAIGSSVVYNASTGYDIATGLGSPNVSNLCTELLNV
jgi:subtilase family serine protease